HRSYLVNLQRVREVITWTRNSFSLILDDERNQNLLISLLVHLMLMRIRNLYLLVL
ncbi:LytTR family transcriptional regulator DNA-binding domain-containing protein, partial [Escherichia coli]